MDVEILFLRIFFTSHLHHTVWLWSVEREMVLQGSHYPSLVFDTNGREYILSPHVWLHSPETSSIPGTYAQHSWIFPTCLTEYLLYAHCGAIWYTTVAAVINLCCISFEVTVQVVILMPFVRTCTSHGMQHVMYTILYNTCCKTTMAKQNHKRLKAKETLHVIDTENTITK